ncbi:MAG: Uma2 family endonuclease [Planctomycetes bacterium]|nr:Uma2 family endonuclease [Planctomycetota bacterium]
MPQNAIVIEGQVRIPADIFTLEKFREWAHSPEFPRSGWISYIGGEIEVEMSPEELETHNKAKGYVFGGLLAWIQERDLGELLGDRAFLVHEAADLATEPDILFCTWEALRTGRVRYAERKKGSKRYVEVVGSPDVVVEFISDNSVQKDTVLLRERYHRAGIPEYWLVDARGEAVDFRILLRSEEDYVEAAPEADGYLRSGVLGGCFHLTRTRNRVGGYSYRLLSR